MLTPTYPNMSADSDFGLFDEASSLFDETSSLFDKATETQYDLITFLAVVQRLQIDTLPITWQSALPICVGETSKVNQALVNLQTSFAFKRIVPYETEGHSEQRTFRLLINEITVLCHQSIRKHPNIIELQGICWDVPSDEKVWPVLVFEKAEYGDLSYFTTSPVGRDLCIGERLKLCVDTGTAIMDLHFNSRLLAS